MKFDQYVVVDWSASSSPRRGADSVWIALADDDAVTSSNPRTRHAAQRELVSILQGPASTLLCVDFSLGYPAGTAAALGLEGWPWASMWGLLHAAISDDERNRNNRFDVGAGLNELMTGTAEPFWGCPPKQASDVLPTKKPERFLRAGETGDQPSEWRVVEKRLRSVGLRPSSAWQLLGAGSVGSQSLVGIPVLESLRRRFGARVHVWPFEGGPTPPPTRPGSIVIAEIWPSMREIEDDVTRVRDALQVEASVRWLRRLGVDGRLEAIFEPQIRADLVDAVRHEEGWVLGVMVADD